MGRIAARTRYLLDERGPGSIGFYTAGQLFLEEYYTLAVLARAGIGTNHLDGNTRLCTATAAEALKESFGSDGQPGSGERAMNALALTLRTLHHGERHLEKALMAAAERHRTEHEIHHVATDLARWSHEHGARLADTGHHYGLDLSGPPDDPTPGPLATLRAKAAEAMGRRPEPGLLLLHDLLDLHLAATRNSVHWEMLAQAAQAGRDPRLLALASDCHPQTLRQIRWTNTMIKQLSPQVLTSV